MAWSAVEMKNGENVNPWKFDSVMEMEYNEREVMKLLLLFCVRRQAVLTCGGWRFYFVSAEQKKRRLGEWGYFDAQLLELAKGYGNLAQDGKDYLASLGPDTSDEDDQVTDKGKRLLKTSGTDRFTGMKRSRLLTMYYDISTTSKFGHIE